MKKLLVLPGDGIGREVCDAALPVLKLLNLPIELQFGEIGWECWKRDGDPVPETTWKQIAESDAVLLGAITSKGKKEAEAELAPALQGKNQKYVSPVIQMRQRLDLFANVRPVQHMLGNRKPFRCCVIRENTEGMYSGLDKHGVPIILEEMLKHPNLEKSGPENAAFSVRLQTKFGMERLFRYAFSYAVEHKHARVTLADKPNVLRESGQFIADIFYAIAADYPEIEADIHNVDAVALWLERRPQAFGVIVAENMFGDILSDLAGGVMGGLGLAPSANIGNQICYFEPVHGSAPKMAGKGRANPAAMFMTIGLTLRHLGFHEPAARIEEAVKNTIQRGKTVTYDLGGNAGTQEMAQAILAEIARPLAIHRASILCIGDELLRGEFINSNMAEFSKKLHFHGYQVGLQIACGDQLAAINNALGICFGQSDTLIISGGLGPTSDDLTREAIAIATERPLEFDSASWQAIQNRLQNFGLKVHPSNRKQALFPRDAVILPNEHGTASGFSLQWQGKIIHVLPGPPNECLPMLDALLAQQPHIQHQKVYQWRLLGVIESDIADAVDQLIAQTPEANASYLWRYPYVDVRLALDCDCQQEAVLVEKIEILLAPHVISTDGRTALEIVRENITPVLNLRDEMTQGAFAKSLPHLQLSDTKSATMHAWLVGDTHPPYKGTLELRCHVHYLGEEREFSLTIPKRGPEIINYFCEFIAWAMLRANLITYK
ncbi:3-isopropylmalate dehydrogenase [Pseudomonas sp. A25(2017)]|uniref:isocitrate/isopropylmalate dehydrogenase family protein n=1 Tax=Pseudomonas sp. A25(2017) TaxID=1945865 RepID=UPI0009852522|nr:isocitrate/isopropylmalate dehydrogenase family protein [Pseudomonas sp. A25(2017)]OOG85964.1 3-isopropylmalate dehydrogenase [Pseudomonas sp. A25(2017)]